MDFTSRYTVRIAAFRAGVRALVELVPAEELTAECQRLWDTLDPLDVASLSSVD